MNKYLNIIIIAFFSILSVRSDYGYSLVIPILLIYASCNSRSLILFIPVSLASIYVFKYDYFISCFLVYIGVLLYTLFCSSKNNYYLDFLFVFLFNFSLFLFLKEEIVIDYLYLDIIYSLISCLMFLVIKYLIKINQGNFVYFEVVAISVSLMGASNISFFINIPFILACFYAMYFSCNTSSLFSLVFSICVAFILIYTNQLVYVLILPFISAVFHLNNIIASLIVIVTLTIVGLFFRDYFNVVVSVSVVCLFYEITKFSIVTSRVNKKETYEDIYKKSINILNEDILAFSSFLDMCTKESQVSKEYLKLLNEGVKNIKANYCNRCYRLNKCQVEFGEISYDVKRLINEISSKDFNLSSIKSISVCPYNVEMKKSAILINNKISNLDVINKNKIINKTLNNISLMLRQFIIDNNIKKEIDYDYLYKIKKALADNGYNLCYFEPTNIHEDNFQILVGIRGFLFKDIYKDIEQIVNSLSDKLVNCIYSHTEQSKVYVKIVPKRNIAVEYAKTNIASGITSGDNLLISDTFENKTICLICDGMGKGEGAFEVSNEVIRFVEKILKTSVSTYAAIQILNTYMYLKQTLETYSTLDFLEIDKMKCSATFYKLSAAVSYIYHNSKHIEKIENECLPVGSGLDVTSATYELSVGDLIIMSSDGVFENLVNERELENFISSITHLSADKIVFKIVNYLKNVTRLTDDDLSIIVIKILEC